MRSPHCLLLSKLKRPKLPQSLFIRKMLEQKGEPTQSISTLCTMSGQEKKNLKIKMKWSGIAALVADKIQSPCGVWGILLKAGQTRANASSSRWTWQSALTTDGPTRAISNQEGASFQGQNSHLENVLLPKLKGSGLCAWVQQNETK